MSKSFRVRTEVGKDKNVTFELNQKFDLLEILSLSLTQQEVYTRMCADFGVVVGRVTAIMDLVSLTQKYLFLFPYKRRTKIMKWLNFYTHTNNHMKKTKMVLGTIY